LQRARPVLEAYAQATVLLRAGTWMVSLPVVCGLRILSHFKPIQ
jgi:hypothetical protein